MSTNINFDKKLGMTGVTGISLPSTPSYQNEYSFQFDGVDEYIQTNSTYSQADSQSKITISAWVKVTTGSDSLSYLCTVGGGSFVSFGIRLQTLTSTTCRVYVNNAGNNNRAFTNIGVIKNDGLWHHLMVCLDLSLPNLSECAVYLDGSPQTMSGYFANATLPTSTSPLFIGVRYNDLTSIYGGLIDEFAIWSGTDFRNQSDVDTIYNGGVPNNLNDNGLTAPTTWFRMGEAATFDGIRDWDLVDQGTGGNDAVSQNIADSERVTDVPPNPFANTKSILLDGIDDYVSLSSKTQNFTDFTLSFWTKGGGGNYKTIVGSNNSSEGGILFAIVQAGGTIKYYDSTSGWTSLSANVVGGNWHHVAITYNSASNTIKGYTDNSLSVTKTGVDTSVTSTNAHSFGQIGRRITTGYYNATLDEIAVFSSVLSASDVSTIYGTGVPNDLSSLSPVHWWRCGDGDTSPILTDNGSGGNDGTMQNFTTFSTDVPT